MAVDFSSSCSKSRSLKIQEKSPQNRRILVEMALERKLKDLCSKIQPFIYQRRPSRRIVAKIDFTWERCIEVVETLNLSEKFSKNQQIVRF